MNTDATRQALEYDDQAWHIGDYWAVVKRRCFQIIVPAIVLGLLGTVVALGLPAVYRSQATILIEAQEIPQDLIRSTVSSYAAQRLQVITQRVMTVENVGEIVSKFDLYGQREAESRLPRTELAVLFRNNVNLDLVSAEVTDPRSGRSSEATIAFTLSFDDIDPSKAQKVTNELVTRYLDANLNSRADKASSAFEFLSKQTESLNRELELLESELARFKEINKGALPEFYQFNLGVVERTEREVSSVNLRLQELEKARIRLTAELAMISPTAPTVLSTGETVLSDRDRLKAMQSEYRKKAAVYKDTHPDIRRLNREIEVLQSILGMGGDISTLNTQIRQQREQLQHLRERYTADHPLVVAVAKVLRDLEARAANQQQNTSGARPAHVADNPAYVLIDTQLKSAEGESRSLYIRKAELNRKLNEFEMLLQRAPGIEKEYQGILREYNSAKEKFTELREKQREAELAQNLEQERKGERFTLIEPPDLPVEPQSPNRIAIIIVALLLAGAVGAGSGFLFETTDKGIYGARQLQGLSNVPVLVVIPYLYNSEDKRRLRNRVTLIIAGILVLGVAMLLFVHFAYKPLDVLWYVLLNRVGLD